MSSPKLIVFSGLPGVGKSTLAAALAQEIGAVYLPVDPVEAALSDNPDTPDDVEDKGYRVLWALAAHNLAHGLDVVGDCVNPVSETRLGWRQTAHAQAADLLEIEVICSDKALHRERVMARRKANGTRVPTWASVSARDYTPQTGSRLIVDTAELSPEAALARILDALF